MKKPDLILFGRASLKKLNMAKKFLLLIILSLIVTIFFPGVSDSKEKIVDLTGMDLWPSSATSIAVEEVAKLNLGDAVTIIIESDKKYLISSAIKLEKLPVTFEETEDKNLTRILIKLK